MAQCPHCQSENVRSLPSGLQSQCNSCEKTFVTSENLRTAAVVAVPTAIGVAAMARWIVVGPVAGVTGMGGGLIGALLRKLR